MAITPALPQTDYEMKLEVQKNCYAWYALACEKFGIAPRNLVVRFDLKNTIAGQARIGKNEVAFNPILAVENWSDFEQVIIHEVVHFIVRDRYPRAKQAHGREFRSVMISLGARPERCHNYNIASVSKPRKPRTIKRYYYECEECHAKYLLSTTVHNKIKSRKVYCTCSECHSRNVKFVAERIMR